MTERLRPRDLALLADESPTTPMHNATVEIFDPGESGLDHDTLVRMIRDRIPFVPRYRQRVQSVPGGLAPPEWVDDPHFDLGYHVRRSALPRPGTLDQLRDLVARIVSRPLDRSRPLWEIYLVEGLADGQVALLYKTHQVLVDGVDTVELAQVLLDDSPERKELGGDDDWRPGRRPSPAAALVRALKENATQPATLADTVRVAAGSGLRQAEETAKKLGRAAGELSGRRPVRTGPLTGPLSQQRRVVGVTTRLEDYRRVRHAHGGSVNDVILATITGGLRNWLMTRGESLAGLRQVRALVPVSVIDHELEATSLGTQIAPHYVELPVGEPSPVVRLHQVSYSFKAHQETGRGVAADRLARMSGFAPSTFHAIGARLAAAEQRRGFALTVTNVPGPQAPLYAAGARMVATYPVPALLPDHALAIGVTSYDGCVYYGLTADRDLLPDAGLLAQCLHESLDELLDTTTGRTRARRGAKTDRLRTDRVRKP